MTSTPVKLAAYAGGLAVAFAAAFAIGAAASPIGTGPNTAQHEDAKMKPHTNSAHQATTATATLPGLAVSDAGYTLQLATTTLPAGTEVPFRFTVTGPDGASVTSYRETHEKELHLIVVRRDLTGFQHVHPTRAADGTWSVPLELAAAGIYRVFADFQPAALNRTLTLGTDVAVAGDFQPVPIPAPAKTATVDGYDVSLTGKPVAGRETELTFTVRRNGADVTDLQPYLGAFGHLVSLRAGDLAYLHTHPAEEAKPGQQGGPEVRFATTFPTAGTYRLFLDFQVGGQVRTAAFTVTVGAGAPAASPSASPSGGHGHG